MFSIIFFKKDTGYNAPQGTYSFSIEPEECTFS
uniref:Uncharacterized protein n=1 Tax=Myoviridae sp. ct0f722 TaxID=2827599 RepID=A0A8S5LPM6_9CAUD|nr:MAG TPA: hypothetical protein [Myoviridae sp. ct0f722]